MEHALLPAGRVFYPDHHRGQNVLEDAGRGKEVGRADLAQVLENRIRVLRAVHAVATDIGLGVRKDIVADPGHGQIGQHAVGFVKTFHLGAILTVLDHVVVAQHHAFRPARGTGRVEHYRRIVAGFRGNAVGVEAGVCRVELATLILNRRILH